MNSANISLLLKPGKDPTLPSSYRPISLINVDLKIICKVLARRLEKITPYIIHSDQTGFIKGRHSADNTRRLINIIDYCSINKLEKIVVSLDAEKAFDRVNWKFLLAVLHKFGFGPSFINWIETLYSSPNARVRTNDLISQSFSLQRGTRQGCPLSPSMFIIFIEPLAAKIRQNVNIKGIQTENTDHKISLYADDVLLFLGNSQTALLKTITLIDKFSSVSDYSINWSKSTVLPLNCKFQNIITTSLQSGNIRYLGIHFSPRLLDLVRLNHIPLLKTIEDDLTRWNSLPISLMGRVATIKMMILPKVNYLFLMIPNKPSIAWFKSLDSYISKFLWKSKTSRISLKTLQKLKCSGGLELPNFYHYFLANRLQYVSRWMKSNRSDSPWLDLEQTLCGKLKISDLPLISSSIKHYNCFKSLTISTTLIAWWEFLKMAKSSLIPCKLTPIWNNPDICRKKTVLNFSEWQEKGINNLEHVIHDGTFISFEDLILKYEISSSKFLEYHQLRSIIQARFNLSNLNLEIPVWITDFLNLYTPKLLSKIYKLLLKINDSISLPITKWERDLSIIPDENFWTQICLNTFKMTKNPNLQLIQYKTLHRIHYTGHRMFQMGLRETNICTNCTGNYIENYMHAIWSCMPVQRFWQTICEDLSTWFHCDIQASPKLCILGDISELNIETNISPIVLTALCIAKKTILMKWKSKNDLCITHYRNLLLDHISLERMSATTKNQLTTFESLWSPLISSIT
uniref:Reverse transcriptase domain-containing protein n=1 Tax=Pygocentrus nattereri TaxID=42514 RepID=A0AAR2LWN9_PYGNA